MHPAYFRDRQEAGRLLAARLSRLAREKPIVVALPRGGVPVAREIAHTLDAPLDLLVVRKIGAPSDPEVGVGAVAEDGATLLDEPLMALLGVTLNDLAATIAAETAEVGSRIERLRGHCEPADVRGRTVIVVDDGVATGNTARIAIDLMRRRGAARVVLAAPVGAPEALSELYRVADNVVCLHAPRPFDSVGSYYEDFHQLSDAEVRALIEGSTKAGERQRDADAPGTCRLVELEVRGVELEGEITLPPFAKGIVVLVRGSGSNRTGERSRFITHALHEAGFGTLLFDLLTREERESGPPSKGRCGSDILLLAERLVGVTDWLLRNAQTTSLPIGYYASSTGAAVALVAAAERPNLVRALVSCGGRPDLAGPALRRLKTPTLFIVEGADLTLVDLNRDARNTVTCPKELSIIDGATHLFEEAGALERVAELAIGWYGTYLPRVAERAQLAAS